MIGHCLTKPRRFVGRGLAIERFQYQAELISSDACNHIGRPEHRCQDARNVNEDRITGEMAVPIIDLLQPVNIHEEEAGGRPITAGVLNRAIELTYKAAPIGQRCEGIGIHQPLKLLHPPPHV
jgi:hypothetical protein